MFRSQSMLLWGLFMMLFCGCTPNQQVFSSAGENWGVYKLDMQSEEVSLLYGSEYEISGLSSNYSGKRVVFSQHVDGTEYENTEIYTLDLPTLKQTRLTQNEKWDLYPVWSPDGSQIVFLSWREATLDIYLMERTVKINLCYLIQDFMMRTWIGLGIRSHLPARVRSGSWMKMGQTPGC